MALAREIFKLTKLNGLSTIRKVNEVGGLNSLCLCIAMRSKHTESKWKWLRGQKVIKPILEDKYDKKKMNDPEEERRFKEELGIDPPRYWRVRPMTVFSAFDIIEPYVPPEGDGKSSFLSKESIVALGGKVKTKAALRKIKSYESNFDAKIFPQHAHDLYLKAHEVLMTKNEENLSEYATEKAISDMMMNLKNKTLRWKFIESLEPPIIVHARVAEIIIKTNLFAQVTVRFHTKQSLAIYDRFGRLCYGSEILSKDVLEYVVFEKHINNEHGSWKLHAKIIPDWNAPTSSVARTYRIEKSDEDEDDQNLKIPGLPDYSKQTVVSE